MEKIIAKLKEINAAKSFDRKYEIADEYFDLLNKDLDKYDIDTWIDNWILEVYKFGETFGQGERSKALKFINSIENKYGKTEAIAFHKTVIENNFFKGENLLEKNLKYANEYPLNPEFQHNVGHSYKLNEEKEKAVDKYKLASNLNSTNPRLLNKYFNETLLYIDSLIDSKNYELANSILAELGSDPRIKESQYNNFIVVLSRRIIDNASFDKKIIEAEKKIGDLIDEVSKKSQRRLIETVGIFSAILAFIFSTITNSQNYSFSEAIAYLNCLGMILMLFVVTLSMTFGEKVKSILDIRIFTLIIVLLAILLINFKYGLPLWLS